MKTVERGQALLTLSGVSLGYPGVVAVDDVGFELRCGEFMGVVGPNGSGKSTLLKGVLGLLPLLKGEIRFAGCAANDRRSMRRDIGYVPQKSKNDLAFPALVREVVMMGLYAQIGWFRRPQPKHHERVMESLRQVGMAGFSEKPIGALSGGQQQRVMIARSLVSEPSLLVLDEPTAAVDIFAQQAILETLQELNKRDSISILLVTHDINEIVHSCDKVLLVNGGVHYFGTPSEVLTRERLSEVYRNRFYVYDHNGHPHVVVGDFNG